MLRRVTSKATRLAQSSFGVASPWAGRRWCSAEAERCTEEYDVVVVGGGPSGLSTCIKLKQLAEAAGNSDFRIALVEKGSEIGAHTLSGACIETRGLDELLPDWKNMEAPIRTPAGDDEFQVLTKTGNIKAPILPPSLQNHGNYIVSLGEVCKWMGEHAESLGVEIFCGFAGSEPVYENDALVGVQLNDQGIGKTGEKLSTFEPGMILKAKQTIVSEGCRGSLTKKLFEKFSLRKNPMFCDSSMMCQPQTYGLGLKEVWEVPKEVFQPGRIVHTFGWPLTQSEGHDNTYGGSWLYHYGNNLISCGFVVGLDYSNPYIRPYMEFQKWKTHPYISKFLEGGTCISYGARTLSEGGLASLPKLQFPGGILVGDCAGFLNLPKIKGTHTAMKSGILGAEAVWDLYEKGDAPAYGVEAKTFPDRFRSSWLYDELYEIRNVRQMFAMNKWAGVAYTGVTTMFTKGRGEKTLPHKHHDHECLKPASQCKPIEYPKPDGKLTFDLLTNHARSGTAHNADQPVHLKLKQRSVAEEHNLRIFDGPEGRYCPAGVYEFVEKDGKKQLVINAQNCLHCKACDIKDPTQNIDWCAPEGGGGPNYQASM